jgi:hypothetical protein
MNFLIMRGFDPVRSHSCQGPAQSPNVYPSYFNGKVINYGIIATYYLLLLIALALESASLKEAGALRNPMPTQLPHSWKPPQGPKPPKLGFYIALFVCAVVLVAAAATTAKFGGLPGTKNFRSTYVELGPNVRPQLRLASPSTI